MPSRRAGGSGREIIAANLRRFRRLRGLSQEALADKAGVHRTYVGCVERSEKNISIDSLERLAAALNVKVRDLLDEGHA